jgi:hypothetical protein
MQEDQYYVSGKLDPSIFDDHCRFRDPTVQDQGALAIEVSGGGLSQHGHHERSLAVPPVQISVHGAALNCRAQHT